MRKRVFVTLVGIVSVAWPFSVRAERKAMPVIGLLVPGPPISPGPYPQGNDPYDVLRQGLMQAGFIEAENVAIESRFADGHYDRLPALAADLVAREVDVILTNSTRGHWPRKTQPRRSRLSLPALAIRSALALSPVSPAQVAM